MPCYMSPEEIDYYEEESNKKKYGLARSNKAFLQEMACEMARLLVKNGLHDQLTLPVLRWIEAHQKEDNEAGRTWE